ncbi:hypothetical protein RRG08_016260 [Elysia crispata]|uniref:Uncharacterized protein n=1 Tax=Elysia crispata TaxID=231223 RepID=A0AAE1AMQ1_9GAST|nr:hypothetical protein RRG08_016260 [Elysia crispata]
MSTTRSTSTLTSKDIHGSHAEGITTSKDTRESYRGDEMLTEGYELSCPQEMLSAPLFRRSFGKCPKLWRFSETCNETRGCVCPLRGPNVDGRPHSWDQLSWTPPNLGIQCLRSVQRIREVTGGRDWCCHLISIHISLAPLSTPCPAAGPIRARNPPRQEVGALQRAPEL